MALKKNFKNLDELEDAIKEYIYYYNNFRIKSSIKTYSDSISKYGFKSNSLIIYSNFWAHIKELFDSFFHLIS